VKEYAGRLMYGSTLLVYGAVNVGVIDLNILFSMDTCLWLKLRRMGTKLIMNAK
jgi:hypothetical protein